MYLFSEPDTLRAQIILARSAGKKIGFVPTMGALHTGHLSLIERAKQDCDVVVSSIYVNPTQFNNESDLLNYPRTVFADEQLLKTISCDILFLPDDQVMYPQKSRLKFDFGFLETVMEGKYRPGHFNGVAIVVSKLLHMVNPDVAYFGQKDLQQFAIISQLINDLSFPVRLVCCPIMRENDGLAMSSRNMRLTAEQRALAPVLYQTLQLAGKWVGQMPVTEVKQAVAEYLSNKPELRLEYFEIVDGDTLEEVQEIMLPKKIALCIAAYIGQIRLIDNIILSH